MSVSEVVIDLSLKHCCHAKAHVACKHMAMLVALDHARLDQGKVCTQGGINQLDTILHYIILLYITLHYVTLYYITLHHIILYYIIL